MSEFSQFYRKGNEFEFSCRNHSDADRNPWSQLGGRLLYGFGLLTFFAMKACFWAGDTFVLLIFNTGMGGKPLQRKLPFGLPSTPLSRNADQTEWREGIFWLCLANVGLERASAKSQAVSVLFNGITPVVMIQQTELGSLWI